jgi:outer membrane protein OmpA-like peptidoglycan-associated protein
MLMIGYAYEFSGANISSYGNGSHEIMIGFKMCKEKNTEQSSLGEETRVPVFDEAVEEVVEEVTEEVVEEVTEEVVEDATDKVVEETTEEVVEEVAEEESVVKLEKILSKLEIKFPLNDDSNHDFESNESLNKLGEELKKNPETKIVVVGHACDLGTPESNQRISEARADRIKNYLVSKGVSASQIEAKGMSNAQPKVPNTNEANRAINRRVEFIVKK